MMNQHDLDSLIQPLQRPVYEVDFGIHSIMRALRGMGDDYGGLDMEPDYQRGHVWTPDQQQHFIENMLRGVLSSAGLTLQFNCPNWGTGEMLPDSDLPPGLQCIDGLQRVTAVLRFLDRTVNPFGLSVLAMYGTSYDPKRMSYRFRVAMYDFSKKTDVLNHYLAINAGGTPHSATEMQRIRTMADELKRRA